MTRLAMLLPLALAACDRAPAPANSVAAKPAETGYIAKVQALMQQARIAALLVEPGATLDYFTGVQWHRSERTTAALIPAEGEVVVVTPAFEEPSGRETLQVGGEVRPWNEHESPFAVLAGASGVSSAITNRPAFLACRSAALTASPFWWPGFLCRRGRARCRSR